MGMVLWLPPVVGETTIGPTSCWLRSCNLGEAGPTPSPSGIVKEGQRSLALRCHVRCSCGAGVQPVSLIDIRVGTGAPAIFLS